MSKKKPEKVEYNPARNPFGFRVGDKEFGSRVLAADIWSASKTPGDYLETRLSATAATILEAGRKRDFRDFR